MSGPKISVYPVGVLSDATMAVQALRAGRPDVARMKVRSGLRYLSAKVRKREWNAVGNFFNGYLAEIAYPPAGLNFRTCGHGWTKRRAVRRLGEYLARDNAA